MDQTVVLGLLVLVISKVCLADSDALKRTSRQLHERKKWDDAVEGAVVGGTIGSIFGPNDAVGGVFGDFLCDLLCSDDPPPSPSPPTIKCYPISPRTYYAEEGETSAVVQWTRPTSSAMVKLVSRKDSGSRFEKGPHMVVYVAKRGVYASDPCSLFFKVEVYECTRPTAPDNGNVNCDGNPPKFGDRCYVKCSDGYKATGGSSQKCQKDGYFSGQTFSCEKVICPAPSQPLNTLFTKEAHCVDGFNYTSMCRYPCKEGFDRDNGIQSITCQKNGMWYPPMAANCKDSTPPEIQNCPVGPIYTYVGADQKYATVEYIPPTANDTLDGDIDVVLAQGPKPGDTLAIDRTQANANLHYVVYTAVDSGGLEAIRCTFTVIVADLMCDPIENQPKMNVTCTEPLYAYGSSCTFSCFSGYPLEGIDSVTCEKPDVSNDVYWDWGEGNEPTKCTVQDCPDLEPPVNGAMSCVDIALGKYCTMSCNDQYDIPRTAPIDGSFYCDDSQGWLDEDEAPDCTENRRPSRYNLPAEFYYSGECTSAENQEAIKAHVIASITMSKFSNQCQITDDCTIENVNVTCGEVTRKKRSLQEIVVRFEFSVAFEYQSDVSVEEQYKSREDLVYGMLDLFKEDLQSGLFDSGELTLVADINSLASGIDGFLCPLGLIPNYVRLSCSACPTGTKYDEATNDCMKCPVGTYQDMDAQLSCIPCKEGFSTAFTGSRYADNCTEMCPPGYISNYGIVPCYPCGVGTYQAEQGQRSCISCPEGTNSTIQGSISLLNCKAENTACAGDVCGLNGVCVPDQDTENEYTCVCRKGYTSIDCSVPPSPCLDHACQNDATCIPDGTDDYTCTCQEGYTGSYCEHKIVDGGWSAYGSWSTCTKSCGTGSQIRYRSCDIPRPQNGGKNCDGKVSEEQECNTEACPACRAPWRPYGGNTPEVEEDELHGNKTAKLSCKVGTVLSDPTLDTFTCGPDTGYEWMPLVDRKNYPKCTEVSPADNGLINSQIEYTVPKVRGGSLDVFTTPTRNLLGQTPCVLAAKCDLTVTASETSSQHKRNADVTIVVYIRINATFQYGPYFVDGEYQAETVNSTLLDYVTILAELELLMVQLENATKEGSLQVEVDGSTYTPDPDSFSAQGFLGCPAGKGSLSGFCVNCPPGMKESGGQCVACDVGTYQDMEGQVTCTECPQGQVTESTGSDSLALCVSEWTTSTSVEPPVESTRSSGTTEAERHGATSDSTPNGRVNKLVFLAIPGILLPCIITGVLIYCCCIKKKKVKPEAQIDNDAEYKDVDGYFASKHLADNGSIDGNVIMSAPPNFYAIRPTTASDINFD